MRLAGNGHLYLLIGPSGSGKTTIIGEILRQLPHVRFMPTTTTRPPRPNERDGREYFFISDAEFEAADGRGEFLEWQRIHGNRYGTSRRRLAEAIEAGTQAIMSVDILGGLRIRETFPEDSTAIFVRPSSTRQLRERLLQRGDDRDDIATRLERVEKELDLANECDFLVINDNGKLDDAVERVRGILDSGRG